MTKRVTINNIQVYEGEIEELSISSILPLEGKKIYMRKGHGGADPGAVNNMDTADKSDDVYEKNITYKYGMDLLAKLLKAGAEIRTDGGVDDTDDLKAITDDANSWGADLFIDVHTNSYYSRKPNGTLCFYYRNSLQGQRLADLIQTKIHQYTGIEKNYNQGVGHYTVKYTKMTAVIVEYGFLSNFDDLKRLQSDDFMDKANKAIVDAVVEFFNN